MPGPSFINKPISGRPKDEAPPAVSARRISGTGEERVGTGEVQGVIVKVQEATPLEKVDVKEDSGQLFWVPASRRLGRLAFGTSKPVF